MSKIKLDIPKPSKVSKEQLTKIAKTLAYVGASAIIGGAIAILQDQPELFGVYAPVINVLLVSLKQVFTPQGE